MVALHEIATERSKALRELKLLLDDQRTEAERTEKEERRGGAHLDDGSMEEAMEETQLFERLDTLESLQKKLGDTGGSILELHRRDGSAEVIKALVRLGARVGARAQGGGTALHVAALFGQAEAARALVEAGADVDARTAGGGTALHHAAQQGHVAAVRALAELGADVRAPAARNGATASGPGAPARRFCRARRAARRGAA